MGTGKAILFASVIAFGGFLFGYDIGVISGCLIMPDFQMRFGAIDLTSATGYVLSPDKQSEITSLLSAGTFFGALLQTVTADSLGRKYSIVFWAAIFTIGVTIQTATEYSLAQVRVGALSALVPLFNGEAAPKHLRGSFLVLYQVMIIAGLFLSYLIDLGTHTMIGSASWRIPVGIQVLFGLIIMVTVSILPESPRFSIYKNRMIEARVAIASLNSTTADSPLVDDIVAELLEGIREENEGGKATWMECFSPTMLRRTMNGIMLQFLQQLNGQNFYYYYGDSFFAQAGSSLSPFVIQVILGGVSFAMIFPALYLIETMGRRKSLLTGAAIEAVCALIAGLVGHYLLAAPGTPASELTDTNKRGGEVLIAFAILQIAAYSLWWGPTPWVYLGESFPMRVRSKCIALGTASNWLWNFLLGYFSPKIANDIGPAILLIFAGMLVVAFVYVYFFVLEVKGLSLEQVDEMYRSDVKPWDSAKYEPKHGTTRKAAFQRTYYPSELNALDDKSARLDAERVKNSTKYAKSLGEETLIERIEKA